MPGKKTQLLKTAFLLSCLLALGACSSDGGIFGGEKETVEVSSIITPASSPSPVMPALYCNLGQGEALFGRAWHEFADTLFILHQVDHSNIALGRRRGTETLTVQVVFDSGGQKMVFCPFTAAANPSQVIPCTSLYLIENDLEAGIKRTFDIPGSIRGAMISCAYTREHLKPLTAPIEGGQ